MALMRTSAFWKPLVGPLSDWPLAVCHLGSIDNEDLKRIDVMHPAGILESYRMVYNQKQRWGYFCQQDINELLTFKSADSVETGTGKTPKTNRFPNLTHVEVPHCAFDNPDCPKDEPRESIEIRALVVY